MDILLLDPAGSQPTRQRIAVGRSADERFDALLEDSRARVEADDMETQRPAEPIDAEARERNEDPAPGRDSFQDGQDHGPVPAPRPNQGERARDAEAGMPGDRQQPQPTAPANVVRLAAAAQTSPAAAVTAAAMGHGMPRKDTLMRPAPAVPPGLRGNPLPLHNGAPPQNPEPAMPRMVHLQRPLVRIDSGAMPPIAKPQGGLGAQAVLVAQTVAAGATEKLSKAHGAVPGNAPATRAEATATRNAVAARSATATKNAATTNRTSAAQTGHTRGTAPSGLAPFKLPGASAAAGTELSGTAGARPLGSLGFAVPGLGLSTPPATSYIAPATQPSAGLPFAADQVAVQIHKAANTGRDRVNIRLYPADLGRVEVKLEWADDGALRAVISAERSDTLDLLQRDSRALDRALQDAGLKTDSDSLSFDLRSQAERHDKAVGPSAAAPERSGPEDQTDGTTAADAPVPHRAHDGVLDLSV